MTASARSAHPLIEVLRPFAGRFLWAAAYFNAVVFGGMLGYRAIEGWPWLDCLYMSSITATSVGFMEVAPMDAAGRIFTMALMAFGVVGLGFWWALTTALIVETDLRGMWGRRKMERQLERLEGHHIVCGGGRTGRVIAEEMRQSRIPYVVVDRRRDRLDALAAAVEGIFVVEGDATKEATLQAAGIERARGLACCLSDDAENLLLCLTARGLRPTLPIVARADDPESLEKLRRAGATQTVSPNYTGAVRMASALVRPSVVSFLDAATSEGEIALRLEEVEIPGASPLAGRSLAQASIPQRTGLVVLALNRADRPQIHNPGPDPRIEAGDRVIVLGKPDQIERLRGYVRGASAD